MVRLFIVDVAYLLTHHSEKPRTLEAFKFLGVLNDFEAKGSWNLFTMRTYDAEGVPVQDTNLRQNAPATPEIPIVSVSVFEL